MSLFHNKVLRKFNDLNERGVRFANDLTRRQADVVATAKREGKAAFFVRGKLTIGPQRPDPGSAREADTPSSTPGVSKSPSTGRQTQQGDRLNRETDSTDSTGRQTQQGDRLNRPNRETDSTGRQTQQGDRLNRETDSTDSTGRQTQQGDRPNRETDSTGRQTQQGDRRQTQQGDRLNRETDSTGRQTQQGDRLNRETDSTGRQTQQGYRTWTSPPPSSPSQRPSLPCDDTSESSNPGDPLAVSERANGSDMNSPPRANRAVNSPSAEQSDSVNTSSGQGRVQKRGRGEGGRVVWLVGINGKQLRTATCAGSLVL